MDILEVDPEIAILSPDDQHNYSDEEDIDNDKLEAIEPGDICGELDVIHQLTSDESEYESECPS